MRWRELRSGHLQMGAPWLRQGGDQIHVAALNEVPHL
jgi:hypothetical protein